MDTSYELAVSLLKGSSSKNPVADFDLAAKYDGAIALEDVLEKLYEMRQVQRAKVIRSGIEQMEYWLTGVTDRNVPYGRTGSILPSTPVPARTDGEKRTKVSLILDHMEQVGDWCNAADIAKQYGCSCGADFLKSHIARGDVELNCLGHGKKMIRIKPGLTAKYCIERAYLSRYQGLRSMDKKPARNTTKKIQALMAMEEPPKLDEWEGPDNAEIATNADQQLQPQQNKPVEETQGANAARLIPAVNSAVNAVVGSATGKEQHVPQQKRPAFRIAYTNDGCLILKNVFPGMRLLPADIELDVAQTRDLVNFISALDLEAQP